LLKSFRYLLFPFAFLYRVIIWVRNKIFDKNILRSATFNFPLICVGNLAVGGTGKTPMTEYLIHLLQNRFKVATLSRGYKRRTKGFAIAGDHTTAIEIGDEPMQFHQKFPEITVAVGEERLVAIPQILYQRPNTEVILLDDAFQHRAVKAGLNIVLTEYNNLYTRDFIFPVGDLRDLRSSIKRADIIVITKCKSDLSVMEKQNLISEMNPLPNQKVFFTSLQYGQIYHLFNKNLKNNIDGHHLLLLCGIANPDPIKAYLNAKVKSYEMIKFKDHHIFNSMDLKEIKKQFDKLNNANKIIVTTEKDAVRLEKFGNELKEWPVYVLPVRHEFLFDEGKDFNHCIFDFISNYRDFKFKS